MELPHSKQEMWLFLFDKYVNFKVKHYLTITCKMFNEHCKKHPECLQLTLDQFTDNLFQSHNDRDTFSFLTKMANPYNKSALQVWFKRNNLQEYLCGNASSPLHVSFNDQCYRIVATQSCEKLKFLADYELIKAYINQLYRLIPRQEIDIEWDNKSLCEVEAFINNDTTKEKILGQICTFFNKEYNSKNLIDLFFRLFNKGGPQDEHYIKKATENSCFPALVLLLHVSDYWKTSGGWQNNSEPSRNRLYSADDHHTRILLAKANYPLCCWNIHKTNIISYAVEIENIELINSLLSIYYESDQMNLINKSIYSNKLPMFCALNLQSNEILTKLIRAGGNFLLKCYHDSQNIFSPSDIQKLIECGYDINKQIPIQYLLNNDLTDSITLLHMAVKKNNIDLVTYLLENNAHVEPIDIIAACNNNDEILNLLLKASKPDSFCFSNNVCDATNFKIVSMINVSSEKVITKLIQHGFFKNYNINNFLSKKALEILLTSGKNIFDIKNWKSSISTLSDEGIILSLQKNEIINKAQHHKKLDALQINQLLEQMITDKRTAVAKAAIAYGANINSKRNDNTTLLNYAQQQNLDLIPTGFSKQFQPLENHGIPIAIKGTQ
jgi:hypothetical protein